MDLVLGALAWIEGHPVTGAAILAASGFVIVAMLRYFYSKAGKNPYIGPVSYSLGKKYVVTAAHEYVPSEDSSGYKQIQHSRPDQWSKLINIDTSLFGLRHKIVPVDTSAHLAVVIRLNKKRGEKLVLFNR
jgi:hypothetical protein